MKIKWTSSETYHLIIKFYFIIVSIMSQVFAFFVAMRRAGYTQKRIASICGVSPQAVSLWAKCDRIPPRHFFKLSDELSCGGIHLDSSLFLIKKMEHNMNIGALKTQSFKYFTARSWPVVVTSKSTIRWKEHQQSMPDLMFLFSQGKPVFFTILRSKNAKNAAVGGVLGSLNYPHYTVYSRDLGSCITQIQEALDREQETRAKYLGFKFDD